jgi:hypothetical protein
MIPGTYVRQISEIQSCFMLNTLCMVSIKSLYDGVVFRVGGLQLDVASLEVGRILCVLHSTSAPEIFLDL